MRSNIKALFFIMLVIVLAFNVIGCSQGSDSTTVSNPDPSIFSPTGTIQGYLRDTVTQQPIEGAIVDVGAGQATTTSDGQFIIYNVPATTDPLNGTVAGTYQVSVDMRNVTSPVIMSSATTTVKYPNFSYSTVSVSYTSLDDTSGASAGGGSGSNHDTPVSGLVAPLSLTVGKLDSNITGVVAYATTSPVTPLQPVGAGWTVQLVSSGSNNAGTPSGTGTAGTGATGNVVAVTTTSASGTFTFNNIEAMQGFNIRAWDSTNSFYGTKAVTAVADGQTLNLVAQTTTNNTVLNQAVLVNTIDNVAPFIATVTPEVGSDLSPAGGVNVIYTFSEPIRQSAYALCLTNTGLVGSCLYQDIAVNFNGAKAGNIGYTLSWNATATQLTVNIPTLAASSKYTVDLTNALGAGKLTDNSLNATSNVDAKRTVTFTTNGGTTAAVPSNVVVTNSASIDYNDTVTLDWLPASGANSYNIYRTLIETWNTGSVERHPARLISNTPTSDLTDDFATGNMALNNGTTIADLPATQVFKNFVAASQVQLSYEYVVVGVNSDGIEGTAASAVTALDVMGPNLAGPTAAQIFADLTDNNNTINVCFNEPLDEASAETVSNYTISGISTNPTISAATYKGWNTAASTAACGNANQALVQLTLSAAVAPQNIMRSYISAGADGIRQSAVAGTDLALNGKCISPAAGAALATAAAVGDDVRISTGPAALIGIWAGANGVCDTTAAAGDTQVVAVTVAPNAANQIAILAATGVTTGALNSAAQNDFTLESTVLAGSDDQIVPQVLVTVGTGAKDVAGNTLNLHRTAGAATKINTDLSVN